MEPHDWFSPPDFLLEAAARVIFVKAFEIEPVTKTEDGKFGSHLPNMKSWGPEMAAAALSQASHAALL